MKRTDFLVIGWMAGWVSGGAAYANWKWFAAGCFMYFIGIMVGVHFDVERGD